MFCKICIVYCYNKNFNKLLFVYSCSNNFCNIYFNSCLNFAIYYFVCFLFFNFNNKSFCSNYLQKNLLLL